MFNEEREKLSKLKPEKVKKMFIDHLNSKPIEKMRVLNQLINVNAADEAIKQPDTANIDDYEEFKAQQIEELQTLAKHIFQCPAEILMKNVSHDDRVKVLEALVKIRDENVEQLLHYVRLAQTHSAVDKQDDCHIGKMLQI